MRWDDMKWDKAKTFVNTSIDAHLMTTQKEQQTTNHRPQTINRDEEKSAGGRVDEANPSPITTKYSFPFLSFPSIRSLPISMAPFCECEWCEDPRLDDDCATDLSCHQMNELPTEGEYVWVLRRSSKTKRRQRQRHQQQ